MQSTEKLKDIPIIIMSSNEEMESLSACLNNGAKDYLIKPIRIQVFLPVFKILLKISGRM